MKMSQISYLNSLVNEMHIKTLDSHTIQLLSKKSGIHLDNIYQELEMDDPYAETHEDPGDGPEMVQLHSHSFYEILYICSGNLQYLIRTERYQIQKGDIIIIPPGVSHQPLLTDINKQSYRRYVLWLNSDFVEKMIPLCPGNDFHSPSLLRTSGTVWTSLEEKFRIGVYESERKNPGWQTFVYGNTLELMTMLYRANLDQKHLRLVSERPELLEQILSFIEENLSQNLSLDDTARRFYVSRSTISNNFRKEMGISFYRYVTQRRLVAAKNYILAGESMENVAGFVGFSDYSSFYRAFKGEYGISPRQFREQQC